MLLDVLPMKSRIPLLLLLNLLSEAERCSFAILACSGGHLALFSLQAECKRCVAVDDAGTGIGSRVKGTLSGIR